MSEYKYQREFPRPFINTVSDISATDNDSRITKVMDWKNYTLPKEFKNKLVDKLDGEFVMFDGKFFIGSDDDNEKSVQDMNDPVFDQKASANNCFLYFVDSENMISHKICMMRGWGHLTGIGALHLDQETAAKVQDGTLDWICETLNIEYKNVQPIKYRKVMPDDPEEGISAQYNEFFHDINEFFPDADVKKNENEETVPYAIDAKVDSTYISKEISCSTYDGQTSWYYQNMPTSKYTCDKKSLKPKQPWYVNQINRNHNKKHK